MLHSLITIDLLHSCVQTTHIHFSSPKRCVVAVSILVSRFCTFGSNQATARMCGRRRNWSWTSWTS